MGKFTRKLCAFVLAITTASSSLAFAAPQTEQEALPSTEDMLATYFRRIDQEMPWVTEFGLGDPVTDAKLVPLPATSPLLDQDPYFLRGQQWAKADTACTQDATCFKKAGDDLYLTHNGRELTLKQKLTPVFEDHDYVILTADEAKLFTDKDSGENHGEGFFFINKLDLEQTAAVPVFFFPLPEVGWTGPNDHAFALTEQDQIVLYNNLDKGAVPVDREDLASLEKIERDNLVIGRAWAALDNDASGMPQAGSTAVFGLMLSGRLPKVSEQ